MNSITLRMVAVATVLSLHMAVLRADTVNPGNIVTFSDGQPANAGEVNGNFDELINQINDHDARIDFIENLGLLAGSSGDPLVADCANDGAGALQTAINSARNNLDLAIIEASGSCGGIFLRGQYVVIFATAALTIQGDGANDAVVIRSGGLLLADFGGGITIDGNGAERALQVNERGGVQLRGNVIVSGATQDQILVAQSSSFQCVGTCTVGTSNDGATALRLQQSQALLANLDVAPNVTLNLNSSGKALFLDGSTFDTREFVFGSTQLNIPNATEIEAIRNSNMVLGPSNITVTGDRFRINGGTVVESDSSLFDAAQTASWNTAVSVDRGSSLRLNLEDAPADITFTVTGNIDVGVNSNFEAFGVSGEPDTLVIGAGAGSRLEVVVQGNAIFNAATVASDTIDVLDGTLVFADDTSFEGGVQPTINVSYTGLVLDNDGVDGALTGDVSSCATSGVAYNGTTDACP